MTIHKRPYRNVFRLFSASLLAVLFAACNEDTDRLSPVFVETDLKDNIVVRSGEYVPIKVMAGAEEGELRQLSVYTFDPVRGNIEVEKKALSGKYYEGEILYLVPELKDDTTAVTMCIDAENTLGQKFTNIRRNLVVVMKDAPLSVFDGVMLQNPNDVARMADAYSLTECRAVIRETADPALVDIYVANPDELPEGAVNELNTLTDVRYALSPTFDYASATTRSVKTAYTAAISAQRIRNIKDGDIILIGHGNNPAGVIKINRCYPNGNIDMSLKLIR